MGRGFRLSSLPFDHSGYSEEFRFTLAQPSGNSKERPYFIYSGLYSRSSFVASSLDLSNTGNFPLGVFVLSGAGSNSTKINLINRSPYGQMISVGDRTNNTCCARKIVFSFYALDVTKPGRKTMSKTAVTTIQVYKLFLLGSRRLSQCGTGATLKEYKAIPINSRYIFRLGKHLPSYKHQN